MNIGMETKTCLRSHLERAPTPLFRVLASTIRRKNPREKGSYLGARRGSGIAASSPKRPKKRIGAREISSPRPLAVKRLGWKRRRIPAARAMMDAQDQSGGRGDRCLIALPWKDE